MIKSVNIRNFMTHSELELEDVPAINVIIGKNDTGKTGLLKLLYSSVKSLEVFSLKKKSGDVYYKKELSEKLLNTFMPRKSGLGDIVKKRSKDNLEVNICIEANEGKYKQPIGFSFDDRAESDISNCTEDVKPISDESLNTLFIPAKEVLTAFNDILNIRDKFYGKGFDDTYFDLIVSLRLDSVNGKVAPELNTINDNLENLFEGKIEQTGKQDQPFTFKKGNQNFAMQQTAEGVKKIGVLTTLISNRQISKGTILFIDEPEANLHPDAIRKLIEVLIAMSKLGVQIFLASHSYFVIKQLAVCSKRDQINTKCWSLEKDIIGNIQNSFHDLIDGVLPPNSIISETLEMYDQEIEVDFKS